MINIGLLSIITVLSVFGIYFLIKEITSFLLRNHIKSRVMLEIHDDVNATEVTLRDVLFANPGSEIEIIDKSGNEEIKTILKKLSDDIGRIHITENAPEK